RSCYTVDAPTESSTLSLHDALPISGDGGREGEGPDEAGGAGGHHRDRGGDRPCRGDRVRLAPAAGDEPRRSGFRGVDGDADDRRSEEHTSELQSRENLVCRLLLEKK